MCDRDRDHDRDRDKNGHCRKRGSRKCPGREFVFRAPANPPRPYSQSISPYDITIHSLNWSRYNIPNTMSAHNYRVAKPTQRTPICDTCKSRHQKCSGEKPQCSNCKLRGINCAYSATKTRATPAPETSRSPPESTPFVFRSQP